MVSPDEMLDVKHVPLAGTRARELPADAFQGRAATAVTHALDRGRAPGRSSLALAYAVGLLRLTGQLGEAPLPGWLDDNPDPWVLALIGFLQPDEQVPHDPEHVRAVTDQWLAQLDQHGANDRIVAFNRAIERVAASSDPHGNDPAIAVLIEAVDDPLCLEPLPARLEPAQVLAGSPLIRQRPSPGFELPRPQPPSSRWKRLLTGDSHYVQGTFGHRLVEGINWCNQAGFTLKPDTRGALLLAAVGAGYHSDAFDGPDDAAAWAWGAPEGTAASTFVDVTVALGDHADAIDVLRYAGALDLFDQPDAVDQMSPVGEERTAVSPYAGRSRIIPGTRGKTVVIEDPEQRAELQRGLEAARVAFCAKFGREPGPEDPIFFDPDADEPVPAPLAPGMLETANLLAQTLGTGSVAFAYLATGGLLITDKNRHLIDPVDVQAFLDFAGRYEAIEERGLKDGLRAAAEEALALAVDGLAYHPDAGCCVGFLYQQLAWVFDKLDSDELSVLYAFNGTVDPERARTLTERIPADQQPAVAALLDNARARESAEVLAQHPAGEVAWAAATVLRAALS